MSRKIRLITLITLVVVMAACQSSAKNTPESITPSGSESQIGLPNPASVYCVENGGVSKIRTNTDGSQYGVCIFPDGSECDEWAYYRGECAPKSAAPAGSEAAPESGAPEGASPQAGAETAPDGWLVYRNETLGYSFQYPAGTSVLPNDDPLKSITIAGAVTDGETWPAITISHPTDREEYRPPENADLETWLTEHNLVGENRQPDLTIAGELAIHYRHERSPQSYADDRYYFAHQGQLYMIVIGHTGDKEDWELYNRFLESFEFEPG